MYALVIKGKRTLYLDEEKVSNWEERKGETLINPGFVSDVSIERVSYNRYELEAAAKALMVSNAINGLFADVRYSIIEVPEINIERELTVNAMLGAAELEPDKERKRKLAEQAIVTFLEDVDRKGLAYKFAHLTGCCKKEQDDEA